MLCVQFVRPTLESVLHRNLMPSVVAQVRAREDAAASAVQDTHVPAALLQLLQLVRLTRFHCLHSLVPCLCTRAWVLIVVDPAGCNTPASRDESSEGVIHQAAVVFSSKRQLS